MDAEKTPGKLRPSQIAVLFGTAFAMALMALSFGFGLYFLIHPPDDPESGAWSQLFGAFLILFALLPAAGVWGMWMLWNDLAKRVPGSAVRWKKKP